jgi:hypothetical protein
MAQVPTIDSKTALSNDLSQIRVTLSSGYAMTQTGKRTALINACTQGSTLNKTVFLPSGETDIGAWTVLDVPSTGLTLVGDITSVIKSNGSSALFRITPSSGPLRLENFEAKNFTDLVTIQDASNISYLKLKNIKCSKDVVVSYGIVRYFGTTANIDDIEVIGCAIDSCRSGFQFRGNYKRAYLNSNTITNWESYALRVGGDRDAATWSSLGTAIVTGNKTINGFNPVADIGSGGNECDGIAVFGQHCIIDGNYVENIDGADEDDKEGIYVKVRHGVISNNILRNACRREGMITVKKSALNTASSALEPVSGKTINNFVLVIGNQCYGTDDRLMEAGVSIQSDDVQVCNNRIAGIRGYTGDSGGIVLKYREPYANIAIFDNDIDDCRAGIRAWAYGKNISIERNRIRRPDTSGIRLETQASGNVRYPETGSPIASNFVIKGNKVREVTLSGARGLLIATDATITIQNLEVSENYFEGQDYSFSITGPTNNTIVRRNELSIAPKLFNVPTNLRVSQNTNMKTIHEENISVANGSQSKIVVTALFADLASQMKAEYVRANPTSALAAARQWYVGSVNSDAAGQFRVWLDTTAASTGYSFAVIASLEDKLLNIA